MEPRSSSQHNDYDQALVEERLLEPFYNKNEQLCLKTRITAFIVQQRTSWPMLEASRRSLGRQEVRTLQLDAFSVMLQGNPSRIKSATAGVDSRSVAARRCFLCPGYLYEKQKALPFDSSWVILNNPFPICPDHLVVSSTAHLPQQVTAALGGMFSFVHDTDYSYTTFYNGPQCGASAPDHLHFQAFPGRAIPLVGQLADAAAKNPLPPLLFPVGRSFSGRCFTGECDNRSFFYCITNSREYGIQVLLEALHVLQSSDDRAGEPLINLIVAGRNGLFEVILIPRKAHRPSCYYAASDKQRIVSPGAVDVGGIIILPRPDDFRALTREDVLNIYEEVCCCRDVFNGLRPGCL